VYLFYKVSKIRGNWLFFGSIPIAANSAYYLRHVRVSVCPHVSSRLLLDGTFIKICRETPKFVKVGQKYRADHMETKYVL